MLDGWKTKIGAVLTALALSLAESDPAHITYWHILTYLGGALTIWGGAAKIEKLTAATSTEVMPAILSDVEKAALQLLTSKVSK